MKKVTIVVPVYNVEQYIRKCLDSLLKQESADYEVLVVNDGSPANEQVIIDEYVSKYPLIRSLVKENGGYGSVLEQAVSMIETPYMLVCDPDDYLYPDAVNTLVQLLESTESDIAIGAKTLVYADNEEEVYDKSFNEAYAAVTDGKTYKCEDPDFDDLYFIDPSPHSKLYKTALLKEIEFPHKVSFTDNILYFSALNRSSRVVYTSRPLAYYLINREGNTMTDIKLTAIDAERKVLCSLIRQNKDRRGIFYYRMFEAYKYLINEKVRRCQGSPEEVRERIASLYEVIEELLPYREDILKYYKKYHKYPFIEAWRDRKLLDPSASRKAYEKITDKQMEGRQ